MSAAGDALGQGMNAGQAAMRDAFIAAHPPGSKPAPTAADFAALTLAIDKARGNAVEVAIEARGPRIFVGTSPTPDPTQFQEGDIYFLRED